MITKSGRGPADAHCPSPVQAPASESEAARRELVHRILHSSTFTGSERLSALLTYVCDLLFEGRAGEINEKKIGQVVFGRSPDYDPAVDGIVRSQASRLRKRLELYFQQEGVDEPVRIAIPRGSYVPVFEAQSSPVLPAVDDPTEALQTVALSTPAQSAGIPPGKSSIRQLLPWGTCLVLALMLVALWIHDRQTIAPAAPSPRQHPLWSRLFTKTQPTMVVAPDSGLVLFHNLSGRDIDLKTYLDGGYRSELSGPLPAGPAALRKDWLLNLANRRYTSIVDLEAILHFKDRARTLGSEVSVRYARDLRPNDFKTGNVILLGSSMANPWVELYERNMTFILNDHDMHAFWVLNRNPQKGEPARWESIQNDPQRRVFATITYMPNLEGNSNALILEGITMSGTESAMDFLSDDARLLPFLDQIRRPDGTLPHFEVVLETHNMGASSVRSQILAWRAMN